MYTGVWRAAEDWLAERGLAWRARACTGRRFSAGVLVALYHGAVLAWAAAGLRRRAAEDWSLRLSGLQRETRRLSCRHPHPRSRLPPA